MSKEEIVNQLEGLVTAEAFEPNKIAFTELTKSFNQLKEATRKEQQEAFDAQTVEGEEKPEFTYKNDEHDDKMYELVGKYHEQRKAFEKQRTERESSNLAEKRALVEELDSLIKDEENIGKAYKRFDAIKQKWSEIGEVPAAKKRDLQAEYSRLIEQFYYHIHIYRELQINDLKKNKELKLAQIEKIKLLKDEKSINQLDFLIHKHLEEWDKIGPTFQEEWEAIREEFRKHVGEVFDRIKAHRESIKEEHKQNLEKKRALVEEVKALAAIELSDLKQVRELTKKVLDHQAAWKKIGFVGRGMNDKIWKAFRGECDTFFEKKSAFMAVANAEFSKVKDAKKALIEEAKAIYQGEDENEVANTLKGLQRKWKETGRLMPNEEFRMYREFRKYCDAFFNKKKAANEARNESEKKNLHAKEEFLLRIKGELDAKIAGEEVIKGWRKEWNSLGAVAPKMRSKTNSAFEGVVLDAYKSIGISKQEVAEKNFSARLESLSSHTDGESELARERSAMIAKIKEGQKELAQLEGKLDFFKFSKDDNPLKKDLLGKIEAQNQRLDALRGKKKRIDLMIKDLKKQETAPEESAEEAEG